MIVPSAHDPKTKHTTCFSIVYRGIKMHAELCAPNVCVHFHRLLHYTIDAAARPARRYADANECSVDLLRCTHCERWMRVDLQTQIRTTAHLSASKNDVNVLKQYTLQYRL